MTSKVNIIEIKPGQKHKKDRNQSRRDKAYKFNKVKGYNYQKFGHYANKYPKPKN